MNLRLPMKVKSVNIIDKLLSEMNDEWSRSQLQDWIKDLVKVNDKVIKSNYKVKLNDHIIVTEVVEAIFNQKI